MSPTASQPRFTIDPSYSPLFQPSVARNALTLANLSTLTACFAGVYAGVLGLKNQWGFLLYIATAALNAASIVLFKVVLGGSSSSSSSSNTQSTGLTSLRRFIPQLHGAAAFTPGAPAPQPGAPAPAPTATAAKPRKSAGLGSLTLLKTIWTLMAVGQENILTFLLLWIGVYVSHGPRAVSGRCLSGG